MRRIPVRVWRVCAAWALAVAPAIGPAPAPARAAELTVFAAASLTEALQELGRRYERTGGERLRFNFGASSTLALQIQAGAPADLFFSADEAKMDALEKKGLVLQGTRRSLLGNSLVVVVAAGREIAVPDAAALAQPVFRQIAIAEPSTVPAGIYAKTWLQQQGQWNAVLGKVVPTENVRAALTAVESGNVDAAIVYATDARISNRVRVAHQVLPEAGPRITYPVAVLARSPQPEAARRWLAFLESGPALGVFRAHGFSTPDSAGAR